MDYRTFEPDPALMTLIKCYWTLENPKEDTAEKQTIVPDGCMEVFTFLRSRSALSHLYNSRFQAGSNFAAWHKAVHSIN